MARLSELSRSIDGHVAIVTGAASGMGRATAHLLADEGARVVVADLGVERVDGVAAEICDAHGDGSAFGVVADLTDGTQIAGLVEATISWAGRLDVVVNNAGVSVPNSAFMDESDFETSWAQTLDVNLTAHARLVRCAVPHLLESPAARVVNIASTEALVSTAGLAAYAASKAGVIGLTQSLAVELGRHGVTVNAICPGPIDTAMTAAIDEESKATYARRRVPLRRYGRPEEVAQMTLSLCLPASSFVNGVHIPVDGGMSVRHT